MKQKLKKISKILDSIYGWGIFICLFGGGLMFFGYLAALVIGGEIAARICDFIYNDVFSRLIYGGNIIVLVGLMNMYLKKQRSLTMTDTNREAN